LHARSAEKPADDQAAAGPRNRRDTRLAKPSPSARIAAASCAVSASSSHREPAPFNATRHDDNRRPDLEPPRLATPPRHRAAGADPQRVIRSASFAFDPVTTVAPEASKRPSPHVQTARHSAAPTFSPHRQAAKANQPPRFPHSRESSRAFVQSGLCEVAIETPNPPASDLT
jgi:hypothetical protein